MKRVINFIAVILVAITIFIYFPTTVRATTDAVWSGQFTIMVDDETFEPWGYSTDMAILYLCLHDMAVMLRGTSAQFDIRTSSDDRWDFWIARGETYTPAGTEFQLIPERFATRADMGGLFGWDWEGSGFVNYPEQTLLIGIDGIDEPATTLAIRTIQDIDNTYFMVTDLAPILGFHSRITTDRWHPGSYHDDFVEGIDRILTTSSQTPIQLPVQSPEFADMMVRIAGHWVDRVHFDSSVIDESVVWPVEFSISYYGLNIPVTQSVAPVRPEWTRSLWEWEWLWWYPVSMEMLENGLVELTVSQPEQAQPAWNAIVEYSQEDFLNRPPQFYNHRIVVDPSADGGSIDEIILYIGDTPHIMGRYQFGWDTWERYDVQPAPGGGVMLRYVLSRWALGGADDAIRVYRSAEPVEQRGSVHASNFDSSAMELLLSQDGIDSSDRILFELIDDTAVSGGVYYYSLWRSGIDWYHNITPMGVIRVDVNEILGETEPEVLETPESEAVEITLMDAEALDVFVGEVLSSVTYTEVEVVEGVPSVIAIWIWILILLVFVVTAVWFVYRRSK
ncbi:MAG: hypothetical protein FWD03_08630 [Defluviitaleaceae bacterium]|nr:hypothetical protein [Defluviitaleaceae bacterium]